MKRLFARSSFRHFTLSFKDHSPPQSSLKVTPPLLIFHGLLGSCSNFRVVHRYPEVLFAMARSDELLWSH